MAERNAAATRIELRPIDAAYRDLAFEVGAAIIGRLPRLERAKHLRGERFVDLVDVERLEREGRLRVLCDYPEVASLEDWLLTIQRTVEEFKPNRVEN